MSNFFVRRFPSRTSIRLRDYDYTQDGAYFITIVAYQRHQVFSRVDNSRVELLPLGQIIHNEWMSLPDTCPYAMVDQDYIVVMPDHVHVVVWLRQLMDSHQSLDGAPTNPTHSNGFRSRSVASVIAGFKSRVTKLHRIATNNPAITVWQRGYYESIIRDADHLLRVQRYIRDNPVRWSQRNTPT